MMIKKNRKILEIIFTTGTFILTGCSNNGLDNPFSNNEMVEDPIVSDNSEIAIKIRDGYVLVEGDMLVPSEVVDGLQSAESTLSKKSSNTFLGVYEWDMRWPNGIVPYVISINDNSSKAKINSAIADWNSHTGIKFIPRYSPAHPDYIDFVTSTENISTVGKLGGRQPITLKSYFDVGTATHEMGHAIGLLHEHQRSDRDSNIIITGNLKDEYENMSIMGTPYGPYDLSSVMHYAGDPDAVVLWVGNTRYGGKLIAKSGITITPSQTLTDLDIEGVRFLYPSTHAISPAFYLEYNSDVHDVYGDNYAAAAKHYRAYGIKEGRCGSPVFHPQEYLFLNPDLKMDVIKATEHFNTWGIVEDRFYSVCFSPSYYLSANSDLREHYGATNYGDAARHFAECGLNDGRKSSPVFDVTYYRQMNPDVKGFSNQAALIHFRACGMGEGRIASPTFNVKNYLKRYVDLRNTFGATNYSAATIHWLTCGMREGRIGT